MSEPQLDLFGDTPDVPPIKERLSADRQRTARQHASIDRGVHPLTHLALHAAAPADAAPGDRGRAFTCGTCEHRQGAGIHGDYRMGFPKCDAVGFTNGPATDCRAWWPACKLYVRAEH